ncbi:MAG: methyltransferase domain-containing protein [Rhodospirillaceae bacterium]
MAEKIWGAGFVLPGGIELITTLTKPLGLNPAMTVLELGSGLGGSTRCMASQNGCWVTGLEASPFLAEQGMLRSTKAGLGKQAPIEVYDPENLKYGKRVDVVFAKDVFYTIKDKSKLFDRIEAILKPRGQFLFTDYVVDPDKRNSRSIVSWCDREPLEPQLWTLQGALDAFTQCNLDLRVHEDITAAHRLQILAAIKSLTEHLEKHYLDKETKINVIDEVETWAQRVAALGAGLKCYRFYALKAPE